MLEVYPAAALLLWGLPREGYKASGEAREELLATIEAEAPWLEWAPGAWEACVASDDALDAVLCALIARAAARGGARARAGGGLDSPAAQGEPGGVADGSARLIRAAPLVQTRRLCLYEGGIF